MLGALAHPLRIRTHELGVSTLVESTVYTEHTFLTLVPSPVDLGTVRNRIFTRETIDFAGYLDVVRLVFANACRKRVSLQPAAHNYVRRRRSSKLSRRRPGWCMRVCGTQ